jgi:hypothetical protein
VLQASSKADTGVKLVMIDREKFPRVPMVKNLIEDMRSCADLRRLREARAHNPRSAVRLRAITDLPPPDPLTDDETAEMMRLLIRLAGVGVGRGLS